MQTQTPKYQGEPSIQALATGLGTLGRYGDEYMVHAAHGETVVPAEILEANPELKNQLFQQMRMMGIKDPNRYVVGNSLNSINPLTGQPEFFFKKVFRAIRKVVKKIAPIVVPIIGNMIAPGIGGPIASALMTKMQGGSWGDALKGAALSYGMSALGSGVKGIMSAKAGQGMQGFFSGLKEGALAPFQAASNLFSSGANNPLAQGIFGPRGMNLAFQSTGSTIDPITGQAMSQGFSKPGASFLRRAFDVVTPSYNANLMSPSIKGAGQYANVIGEKGTVYDNIGNKTGINPDSRVYNASITDTNAYPSVQTTSGGGFDNSSQRLGDVNKLGSEFSGSSTSGDIISNADGSMEIINKKVIDGDTSWLDRNLGEKGADVVRQAAGNLVVPAVTTAAAYFMADEEDVPEADDPRLKGQTNAQQQAWSNYNAQRGRADYATWSRSPEAKQLLLDAGIFPSTQSASQIASSAGITQEQAQNYLNNQYAPFVNPLPTQPVGAISQIYNKGGIASFRRGGIQDLMTDATGNSLEQKNEEILLTGNPGDTFIHEGVTYKAGRPPVMVSESETMMTNTATTPGSNFIGSMQPQTASGIFGGSGVATPDPNYTPSPNDFKSPLLQRLAQEAFKTPQTTVPYQQLNMARPLQSPPDIQASGIFMQNPNQQLYAKNVGPQLGGPVNQQQPMILAAGGGEIKGPGTGTSDSIPANLSDGEFVMTAEAVRNAGGGDRNLGAARMYDLMSRFEGGRA